MPTVADLLNPAPTTQPTPSGSDSIPAPPPGFVPANDTTPAPPPGFVPETPQPKTIVRGFGLGTRALLEGAASVPDLPTNALIGTVNTAYLPIGAATKALGGTPEKPIPYSPFRTEASALADAAGLPKPQDASERVQQAVAEGIVGAGAGMGAAGALKALPGVAGAVAGTMAAAPVTQLVGGAASGGAAQVVAEHGGGPLSQFAAGTVAALLGGYGGGRVAGEIPAPTPSAQIRPQGPLAKALAPFTAAASRGAAEQQAGQTLAARASDPQAVAQALSQPGEIVPGSQPTTFQQTGDMGLGALEREVATRDPAAFQQRAAEQNSARRAALGGVEPAGDPNDVAKALKGQFDALNTQQDAAVDAASAAAKDKAEAALGPEATPEGMGAQLRAALVDAHEGVASNRRALYDAIDPDKTLTANTLGTSQAGHAIPDDMPATAKPISGEEAAIFQAAQDLPAIAPLQDLIGLQARTNDAMAQAKLAGDLQSHRRLALLRGAIEDNLAHTIGQEVANQAPRVLKGELTGNDALVNRLASWIQQHEGGIVPSVQADAQRGGFGQGVFDQGGPGRAAPDAAGAPGANGASTQRPGGPAGNPGVSAGELAQAEADLTRFRQPNPNSLFGAIKKLGGLRTRDLTGARIAGPDVEAALTDIRQPGLINNKSGYSPERVAQALADAGWFGPNPGDPSAAFEAALSREARGAKVFHPEDTFNAEAHARLSRDIEAAGVSARATKGEAQKLATYRAAIRDMRAIAEQSGILGADRMTPEELLTDLQEREAIRAEAGPTPPDEHEAEFDRLSAPGALRPTVDDAAKARLDTASQAYRQERQTFGKGPVGEVLNTFGRKDDFRLPNGEVAAKFFKPGAGGFERVQALEATGAQDALPTIERFAAHTLRRAALRPDGTLDPTRFAAWQKNYADALRALPAETRAKFASAAKASETLANAQAERATALKVAQQGAIGKVMGLSSPEDVVKTVGQILGGRTAVADMKTLAKATAGDPVARQGLRRAITEHIASKFIGNTEAATSGESLIKADAYQTFIRQNRAALHLVFSPEEVRTMEAVAEDIQRAKRSQNAVRLPGGSNTAQDSQGLAQRVADAAGKSWLHVLGGALGATHGPLGAAAGVMTAHLTQALRARGIARVDQLVSEAMLDPSLARELLKKAPRKSANWNMGSAPLTAALWGSQTQRDSR